MVRKPLLEAVAGYLHAVDGKAGGNGAQDAKRRLLQEMSLEESVEGRPWRRILVAVDHEDHAAVKAAVALADRVGAVLGFVNVVQVAAMAMYAEAYATTSDPLDLLREHAAEVLRRCVASVPPGIPTESLIREGCVSTEIAAAARDWQADILVLGTHRRGPVGRLLLGSTSAGVIPKTRCPVLLVTDEEASVKRHATAAEVSAVTAG